MIAPVDTIPETKEAVTQLPTEDKPIKVRKKRAPKHNFKDGHGSVFAHRHDNGGGWVADTAKVADQVYVGPRCEVYNYAIVNGKVTLKGKSKIFGNACVYGDNRSDRGVQLNSSAMVYGRAIVRDEVLLENESRVHGNACISGASRLFDSVQVFDAAQIISTTLLHRSQAGGYSLLIRSNIKGDARTERHAVVVGSTLNGFVLVTTAGQVINSTVENLNSNAHTTITDNAIVLDGSRVLCPIIFRQRAMCRQSVVAIPRDPNNPYYVPEVTNNTVLSCLNLYSRDQFDAYIEQVARNRSGLPAPAPTAPAAPPGPTRANYLNLPQNNRRIMTLQETPA